MVVTSLNNSETLAKKIAKEIGEIYKKTKVGSFPDGDIYMTLPEGKGKLILVESFHPNPNKTLFNILFAAKTAKDIGYKKVILIAPYLAFMRQDKRFNPGEAINSHIMGELLSSCIDKIITIDPHLHRHKNLKEIFTVSTTKLSANNLIAESISKMKNQVIVGPDWESYQWAESIAKKIKVPVTVFRKTRYSSNKVKVEMLNQIDIKNKNVVIVDDIISTGHTIAEAIKIIKPFKPKSITVMGIHGIFATDILKKEKIITTNTIGKGKIDVTKLICSKL